MKLHHIRIIVLPVMTALTATSSFAGDLKLVGTWEGFAAPVYTKLVFREDGGLTYCSVASCRDVSCYDMPFEGSLDGVFTYSDNLRSWTFQRVSEDVVQAQMSTASGTSAIARYERETPAQFLTGG